jgi:S1-C subfamily serine protease
MRRLAIIAACLAVGGCSLGSGDGDSADGSKPAQTATTRVEVIQQSGGGSGFDPKTIYERDAPGVVTVVSVFDGGGNILQPGGEAGGVGSGFVLNERGEIATNAHVVTQGEGRLQPAKEVYVEFADGNQVPAKVVGADPFADIALLEVDPAGLTLRPLRLGSSADVEVGVPVAAMGSPFGERQSLSVGVVSAIDRSIRSLTNFQISGAIQTDAAINPGNSGGPLVDADGRVIGVNQQIRTTSGGGEGVGFAVPVDVVKRSLEQLREDGKVEYAYLGVRSSDIYPQLAERFDLPVEAGAWVQEVSPGGPAEKAGLKAGGRPVRFQTGEYVPGGDIITAIDGRKVADATDLSQLIETKKPGATVTLEVQRDGKRREIRVTLGTRPVQAARG